MKKIISVAIALLLAIAVYVFGGCEYVDDGGKELKKVDTKISGSYVTLNGGSNANIISFPLKSGKVYKIEFLISYAVAGVAGDIVLCTFNGSHKYHREQWALDKTTLMLSQERSEVDPGFVVLKRDTTLATGRGKTIFYIEAQSDCDWSFIEKASSGCSGWVVNYTCELYN